MAGKLKSILKQIHWSLLLKAAIFSLAWAWLPFWVFALVAAVLYLIPFFRPGALAWPFLVLLVLAFLEVATWPVAFLFGVLFYALLLIKDLFLVDRRSAYEILILALSFTLLREFYIRFDKGATGVALMIAFAVAALISLLLENFLRAAREAGALISRTERIAIWLGFLIFSQIIIAGLFLPLDFIYQSTLVFLAVVLFVDLVPEHLSGGLSRTKILTAGTAIFALFVIVLASARWGL